MKDLDWTKINNWKDFQLLINDLFALEINHPGFLSSNPDIGKDGSWDARFEGKYMGLEGSWSFQSKRTSKNLDGAYSYLRGELIKELQKAQKIKVNYLLFATNANLRIGGKNSSSKLKAHVAELEKLNKDQQFVDRLFIWPRANLDHKIKQYPWLRQYYFNDCQSPMFVPWSIFMKNESHLLSGDIIERGRDLEKIRKYYQDNSKNILIIHSASGLGKSHFLKELAKLSNTFNPDYQVWFCQPIIRSVNNAIQDELNHSNNYILILDDAERYPKESKELIAHIQTFNPGNIKLILSCRTSGLDLIKRWMHDQRKCNYSIINLNQLSEKGSVDVLFRAAGTKKINHPDRIVKELNGNLYLITTIAKLKTKKDINTSSLKEQIRNELEYETEKALCDYKLLTKQQIKKLIKELSIVVPLQETREDLIINKLSEIIGLDIKDIKGVLRELIQKQVLRLVGNSIRFNPDMKGDIYLSAELDLSCNENLATEILDTWLSICPGKTIANLGAAARHSSSLKSVSNTIKCLIKSWIDNTSNVSDLEKSKNLELINSVAYLAPDEVSNLIYAYANSTTTLNRDKYGPIISHLSHIHNFQKKTLNIILFITQKNLKGFYHNYKPATLIKNLLSPINANINLATDSLNELILWIKNPHCTELQAKLVSEGAKEALAGAHEYTNSYEDKLTVGWRVLKYSESDSSKARVDKYRDKAMVILENLINHPNNKIKKYGIDIIENIGSEYRSNKDSLLWKRILSDEEQAVNLLETLIKNTTSYELLGKIEDLLIRYWSDNHIYSNISKKAANILRTYPKPPEYTIYRYFTAYETLPIDFAKIEKDAPKSNRWSWIIDNYFTLDDTKEDVLERIIKQLAKKYKNRDMACTQFFGQFFLNFDHWQLGHKIYWATCLMSNVFLFGCNNIFDSK